MEFADFGRTAHGTFSRAGFETMTVLGGFDDHHRYEVVVN